MTKRYEVKWMTENTARVVADDMEHAIVAAMRMSVDGSIKRTAIPIMTVKDLHTGETTVVTIDQEYKVVKVHELD